MGINFWKMKLRLKNNPPYNTSKILLFDETGYVGSIGNPSMALEFAEETARRIVAAANACEGIETGILEALPMNFKEHALELDKLKTQNARLLKALKRIVAAQNTEQRKKDFSDAIAEARAAIAEAENQNTL